MSPFFAPLTRHRAFSLVAALTLAGCSSDAAHYLAAPSAPRLSADASRPAATKTKNVHGTLDARDTDQFQPATNTLDVHLVGTGTASHLGRYTVVYDQTTVFLATGTSVGRMTLTAADGDVLTATFQGSARPQGALAHIEEAATITGGTGRFAGATGTLLVVRLLDQVTGISSGTLDGTIVFAD